MATQPHSLITADEFYTLPPEEGREFELLDGEMIDLPSATPRHNLIVMKLGALLYPVLRNRGCAIPETDFSDGRLTTLRPDLAILSEPKLTSLDLDKLPVTVVPDIVVEVISPSESAFRVERRINAYLRFGVQEIWILYPEDGNIYVHTEAAVKRLRSTDTLQSPVLPDWSVVVAEIFAR